MDFGWLLTGAVNSIVIGVQRVAQWSARWLGQHDANAWVVLAAMPIVLWAVLVVAHRTRARQRANLGRRERAASAERVRMLKEKLRLRLAQPAEPFCRPALDAPTLGARQAFEQDLEAAATTVLAEAGGHKAQARRALRRRLAGRGLNGSEVAYWRQLGALALLDDTREALAAYSRAADLAPDDPEGQMLLGVLSLRAGKLDVAEAAFRRQIRLGGNGGPQRYRGGAMLGDVFVAREAFADALGAYQDAQREILDLLEREPEDAALQRDLSVTCDRIGDVLLAQGDVDAALESYRNGLEIAQALAQRDSGNAGWQRDVSVSHDRIGEVLVRKGDLAGALQSFRQGLVIAERLAERDPGRADWQWDLSLSHDRIGDVLMAQGRAEQALASYRRALAIAEQVASHDPLDLARQRDLAATYHKVGSIEAARQNIEEARDLLEKGRTIIARLERIASYQAQWRSDLSRFDAALRTLGP